jgi:molecular chaperone DnaK (HSP70)
MASAESYIGTVQIRGYKLEPARKPLVRVFYEIANNKITIWAANEKQNGKLSLSMIKNKLGKSVH